MYVPPASCWRHWCVTVCGCAFVVTWWRHRKWQVVVRSRTHPRWSKWCALIPWCELRWRSRCVTYDIWRQVQRNRSFMLLKCMYIIVTVIRFPHIPKIMFSTRFITNFFLCIFIYMYSVSCPIDLTNVCQALWCLTCTVWKSQNYTAMHTYITVQLMWTLNKRTFPFFVLVCFGNRVYGIVFFSHFFFGLPQPCK